jgi:hypothetical protein
MDTPNWIAALGLFVMHPVLIIATFLIACAAFGFAWWLCGRISGGRTGALEERLRLAGEQCGHVAIERVKSTSCDARGDNR